MTLTLAAGSCATSSAGKAEAVCSPAMKRQAEATARAVAEGGDDEAVAQALEFFAQYKAGCWE